MAASFGSVDQAEFRDLYGQSPSIDSFISKVYDNLFGRPVETEGLLAYSQIFNQYLALGLSADQGRAILIARIIDGASGSDKVAIQNKVAVASAVTDIIQLKKAAISDSYDLALVQEYFNGEGTDSWRSQAEGQIPSLVESIQYNDSVWDYMESFVSTQTGSTPKANAAARLSYSKEFLIESDSNTGEIGGSIQIIASGATFTGNSGDPIGSVSGLPAGLTAKLLKISDTEAQLSFLGNATAHNFSNSSASVKVEFADDDFLEVQADEVEGYIKPNLGIGFIDAAISITDGEMTFRGEITKNLVIDLEDITLSLGGVQGRPTFGTITQTINVDLSKASGNAASGVTVNFTGNYLDNDYFASYLGDTIRGYKGDDNLTGGPGIDTFIFEPDAEQNGFDSIEGFDITAGDILNFSKFLNITGTASIATQKPGSDQLEWLNGDVLVYQGAELNSPDDIADLFDATGSDTSKPYAFPKSDGKAVIITSGSAGDSSIWFLTKDSNATETFDTSKNVVLGEEIALVGVLHDVNNLSLLPFTTANFL